jgi:hypothetical protein
MENKDTLNHNLATIGNGALLIWWGIAIIFDPITIGMCAIGTGLIMLGINAARWWNGIATKSSTTVIGVIALAWGVLDTVLNPGAGVSFAMILIIIGFVTIASPLVHIRTASTRTMN